MSETPTPKEIAAGFEKFRDQQREACRQEIQMILDQYSCKLTPQITITDTVVRGIVVIEYVERRNASPAS